MLLAGFARLRLSRRAIGGRREPGVAHPAASAFGDEDAVALVRQVRDQRLLGVVFVTGFFVDQRADRHGEFHVRAGMAGAVRALPVLAARRLELGVEAVVDERVGMRACDDVDGAAVSAVAAARAAARHTQFAPEREAAASAGTGRHVDIDFVNEHESGS